MRFRKGDLVESHAAPIRGEGWPGPEVLGVVYAIVDEGIWDGELFVCLNLQHFPRT